MHRALAIVVAGIAITACGRGGTTSEKAAPPTPPPVAGVRAAPVIDSHVHLSYWQVSERLAKAGVVAAVDLGAPIDTVGKGAAPLVALVQAGPMLTSHDGYPINAWDPGGFGKSCDDAACIDAAVEAVATHGGRIVKVVADDDGLDAALVPLAVRAAHARSMKVAAHALTNAGALVAGQSGCDLLAHTPVEPLSDETIAAWRGRTVVSTLAAFGGSDATVDNLRRLRAAGVTVLYGTDLGNTRTAGVDPEELRHLAAAGLDDAAIVAAMTTTPAAYWELSGALGDSTYVRLARDPSTDATAYVEPVQVWIAGKQIQ